MEATTTTNKSQDVAPASYSVDEVVVVLGLNRATLYSHMAVGKAPPSFKLGHRRFFPKDKLHEWLDAQFAKQNGSATEAV